MRKGEKRGEGVGNFSYQDVVIMSDSISSTGEILRRFFLPRKSGLSRCWTFAKKVHNGTGGGRLSYSDGVILSDGSSSPVGKSQDVLRFAEAHARRALRGT